MEQMFFNEITGHFNLREPKSNKPSSIFFVVSLDKKQYKIPTGIKVYPSMWNKEKEECYISFRLTELDNYNNSIANERISRIRAQFVEFKLYLCTHFNEVFNKIDVLRTYINKVMQKDVVEQNIDIVSFLTDSILNDAEKCGGTEKNYIKIVKAVGRFLEYKGTTISFKEFATTDMFDEFRTYLKDVHAYRGKPLARSTINDYMQNAKGLLRYAVKAKLIDKVSVDNIELTKFDTSATKENQIFLRNDEIIKLYNYKCENEKEEIIKDVFLLECLTGQRISDTKRLSDSVKNQFGVDEITLVQKKTNKKIRCNLIFDMTKQLLEKYNYEIPKITPRSDTDKAYMDTINRYMGKIAKEAGIDGDWLISKHYGRDVKAQTSNIHRYEAIHSHTGRHTFICLLLLRGWPTFQIAKYSGHSTTKMIESYAASMSPVDFEVYEKQKAEFPDQIVKTIEEAKNAKVESAKKEIKNQKKQSVANVVFGYDKLTELYDRIQQKELMHDQPITKECYDIMRSTKGLTQIVEFCKGKDVSELKKKALGLDDAVKALARIYSDIEIYRTYEYKMLKLGLIQEMTPVEMLEDFFREPTTDELAQIQLDEYLSN